MFGSSKSSLAHTYLVSDENIDSDTKLIADLYYDSGLSKDIFNKIYLTTLKRYLSKINSDDDSAILKSIKVALRERRLFYLPGGVCPEDVHSNKDVWTFSVFLAGLIIAAEPKNVRSLLSKILDESVIKWIEDKNTIDFLCSVCDEGSTNRDVQTVRGFYRLNRHLMDSLYSLQDEDNEAINDEAKPEKEKEALLTNKEIGKLFIEWMFDHKGKDNNFVLVDGDYIFIKSPVAFIEFSKENGYSWKAVQKGVFKLSLHEPNDINGTPFHKIKGLNMMKFDLNIKEVLCSHVDYPSQTHKQHDHQ